MLLRSNVSGDSTAWKMYFLHLAESASQPAATILKGALGVMVQILLERFPHSAREGKWNKRKEEL